MPAGAQSGVTAITAGANFTVALKSDGSVIAWGDNEYGQTTVPAGAQSGVTAIAAGAYHTLALKSDGSVIIWSEVIEPVPAAAQSGVIAIAAGGWFDVALVASSTPLEEVTFTKGSAVLGAGTPGGAPAGAVFASFGTPQAGAFAGKIQVGKIKSPALFAADGSLLLKVGGSVPGLAGSIIIKLGEPSGDAVLVTLKPVAGGITAKNNVVLVSGLSTGTPEVAAQTGTANAALPAGVTIKSFGTIDGNGSAIFFLATLQGTGITAKTSLALCAALADGSVRVLASRGQSVGGKTVSILGTLVGSKGTLAEGRWRVDEATTGVRLTFTDKSQALYAIPATAASPADWTLDAVTGPITTITGLNGQTIASFGLPGFGPDGFAVLANLALVKGSVTAANNAALITGTGGASPILLARKGEPITANANGAPLTGITIKRWSDPVVGDSGVVAFMLKATGKGVGAGIGYSADGITWDLLANVGALAPGGGHWAGFTSLVLPDGADSGPIFLGTLNVSKTDGVTAANKLGLWGVDSLGMLRLLLRTGQSLTVDATLKTIKTFTALAAAPGSIGAASGYDDAGRVSVLATFTDGSQSLVLVQVP